MAIDIDYLTKSYFYFDLPVPYKLRDKTIHINPIKLIDSEIFLSSADILKVDKDSIPDPKIIQMSYLQFVIEVLFSKESNIQKLINVFLLSLNIKDLRIKKNELGRPILFDSITGIEITAKQFDDIRRIILYQNIPGFDDEYINPQLKNALDEVKMMKNRNIDIPSVERKIAIITSHCGLSKKEQLNMTYRSHELLFNEICGEVEFTTTRPIALFGGKGSEIEHWIYRNKKGKFDGKVISVSDYNKSGGGNGQVEQIQVEKPSNIGQINNEGLMEMGLKFK